MFPWLIIERTVHHKFSQLCTTRQCMHVCLDLLAGCWVCKCGCGCSFSGSSSSNEAQQTLRRKEVLPA